MARHADPLSALIMLVVGLIGMGLALLAATAVWVFQHRPGDDR